MVKIYKTFYFQAFIIMLGMGFVSYKLYTIDYLSCKTKIVEALDSAIHKDANEKFMRYKIPVYAQYNPNIIPNGKVVTQTESDTTVYNRNDTVKLTLDNMLEKGEYSYLALKNLIDVQELDSLFKNVLKKQGISVQTAVVYTYKDSVTQKSRADSKFFVTAFKTPKMVFGASNEIKIQGFAGIKFFLIVSQQPCVWLVVASVWCSFLIWLIIKLVRKHKKMDSAKIVVEEPVEEPAEELVEEPAEELVEEPVEAIKKEEYINPNLRWLGTEIALDKSDYSIIYHGERVHVTNLEFKLIEFLSKQINYYATYDEINQSLYGKKEFLNGNERLNQLVCQLRRDKLSKTPELAISTIILKGYKLEVKNGIIPNDEQIQV